MTNNPEKMLEITRNFIERPFDGFGLTEAEEEVATKFAQGVSVAALAEELNITKTAVYQRLKFFENKTKIKRSEIVSWYVKKIKLYLGG